MIELNTIKENPNNPRLIDKGKFEKLKQSIKDFPKMMALRPMVVDDDNVVLGGNMRLKALRELEYKNVPDDWVKQASELTEDEKREFIIKDNVGFGEWDWDILANEWDVQDLDDWGLPVTEILDPYTAKVEAPNYEPLNEKPDIKDLIDTEKYDELIQDIEAADISDEVKAFLRSAATRHLTFNYSWIADYYANSDADIQDLFERSALVIIDFVKAIKNGYIELSERMNHLFEQDNEGK